MSRAQFHGSAHAEWTLPMKYAYLQFTHFMGRVYYAHTISLIRAEFLRYSCKRIMPSNKEKSYARTEAKIHRLLVKYAYCKHVMPCFRKQSHEIGPF